MEFDVEGLADLIKALDYGLEHNSNLYNSPSAKREDIQPINELGRKYQAALFAVLDRIAALSNDDQDGDEGEG